MKNMSVSVTACGVFDRVSRALMDSRADPEPRAIL